MLSVTTRVNRFRAASGRSGAANGARFLSWASPSRLSMLGPTTCAVEKPGSSTVNVVESRITSSAKSYRVTSQAPIAGTQETGSSARRRARWACG